MTIYGATSGDKVGITTTLGFQCGMEPDCVETQASNRTADH